MTKISFYLTNNCKIWTNKFSIKFQIKFRILAVHSPKHYSVKILETLTDRLQGWKPFRPELPSVEFFLRFENYFRNPENRILQYPIILNDLCAVEWNGEVYRCRILKEIGSK